MTRHDHNHSHPHIDHRQQWGRRLIGTMALNIVIPAVQIWAGIVAGSMALISDALHNLSDVMSVLVSYAALRLGARGPDPRQTFGYRRVEVLAAAMNVALLFGASVYIAVEAWQRLYHPVPIAGGIVIGAGLVALVANLASSWLLLAAAKEDLNLRSTFLHMVTDALTSLGVVLLGILWIFRPWYWLDPIVSLLIVALILPSGWGILKEVYAILMNATPPGIDADAVLHEIEAVPGVRDVHHLHIWHLSAAGVALATHVVVADQPLSAVDAIADEIRRRLAGKFGIDHPILQFETKHEGIVSILERPAVAGHAGHDHR